MRDSVTVEIEFPFWMAYRASFSVLARSPLQIVFSSIFPLAGVYLLYLWGTSHHHMRPQDFVTIIGCLFFTPIITAVALFFGHRRNSLSIGPFKYTFDSTGIHATGTTFQQSILWAAIRKMVETPNFLLFYIAPARAITIPVAQLKAAGAIDDVRRISSENLHSTPAQ